MNDYEYCILNSDNTKDLEEFEKRAFHAFSIVSPDWWIMNTYQIIDNCRIRPTIGYSDIILYALKENSNILAGMAININVDKYVDFLELGFSRKAIENKKDWCEGLYFFSRPESLKKTIERMKIYKKFKQFIFSKLNDLNVYKTIGSCNEKLKAFHLMNGAKIIDKIMLNGEIEYLIEYLNRKK